MQYLSNKQKAILCQLARKAWDQWPEREAFLDVNPDFSKSAAFEAWRRNEQLEAAGVASLKSATSENHYLRIKAHWEDKLGHYERAAKDLLKHADEACLQVLYKIYESCAQRGLDYPGYPGAICRRQYKCALEEASEKQLWSLCYTIRNRRTRSGAKYAKGKYAKKAAASGQKAAVRTQASVVQANMPF